MCFVYCGQNGEMKLLLLLRGTFVSVDTMTSMYDVAVTAKHVRWCYLLLSRIFPF